MLNRSASLAMSTSILKTLPGKPDIKRHSPSILYIPSEATVYWETWYYKAHIFGRYFCLALLSVKIKIEKI